MRDVERVPDLVQNGRVKERVVGNIRLDMNNGAESVGIPHRMPERIRSVRCPVPNI